MIVDRILRKVKRDLLFRKRLKKAKKLGVAFEEPNYIFINKFDKGATVIDVGCANDADFSMFVIDTLGLKSIGVDPTRKHHKELAQIRDRSKGKFDFLPYAVAGSSGSITFHESDNFASGSLIGSHHNMKRDTTTTYEVETVTLSGLLDKLGMNTAPYIKLDLEGAEYALLSAATKDDLQKFDQIFVEFHHHAFKEYSTDDTKSLVQKVENCGFLSFSLDDHNYLFYKKQ